MDSELELWGRGTGQRFWGIGRGGGSGVCWGGENPHTQALGNGQCFSSPSCAVSLLLLFILAQSRFVGIIAV